MNNFQFTLCFILILMVSITVVLASIPEQTTATHLTNLSRDIVDTCYYNVLGAGRNTDLGTDVGNVCDKSMLILKELCFATKFDTCKMDLFHKYLRGMGQ